MKKILYILSVVLLTASCNFLDFDETSGLYTRDSMYETFDNITAMLTTVYGYMPNKDIADVGSAMRECGIDDAEYGDPNASVSRFNNGNWSAVQYVDDKWSLYKGIRAANEFLEAYPSIDLSLRVYDSNYEKWQEHLKYYPFQARVLRAFYLFELARRYGDIPVPTKKLSIEEANSIAKTPFDEVIDFIVSECDECAANLPDAATYDKMLNNQIGRAGKGFALALKTRALLYAASPLHNASGDKSKWLAAAKAAQELMDTGLYRLDPGEKVNTINLSSPEVIFEIMRSEDSDFEFENFPVRFTYFKRTELGGTFPTQNLVDAFQTADGYDIILTDKGWVTEDPNFDITKPYEGRDPRFARTILANGMAFKGSTIETFVDGQDYSAVRSDLRSPTGYYLRKYIREETSFEDENESENKHDWIVFRYAETLLSYAEAANEYFGDPDQSDGTLKLSAREALNLVRANAGMPNVEALNYNAFVEAVRREWRVEFAFEDHRFWDVRRWKIGPATQTQVFGVSIVPDGGKLEYSRKLVENRTWSDRMYLYPIPQEELFCNPNLNPQNTGW